VVTTASMAEIAYEMTGYELADIPDLCLDCFHLLEAEREAIVFRMLCLGGTPAYLVYVERLAAPASNGKTWARCALIQRMTGPGWAPPAAHDAEGWLVPPAERPAWSLLPARGLPLHVAGLPHAGEQPALQTRAGASGRVLASHTHASCAAGHELACSARRPLGPLDPYRIHPTAQTSTFGLVSRAEAAILEALAAQT